MSQTHHTAGERAERSPGLDRQHLRSYEQLRRSTTDRKIAGVAGGLGRHLDVDPTIVRVLLVVMCLFGGTGFLVYGVAWLLVPEEGREQGKVAMQPSTRNALLIGTGLLAALLLLGGSLHGFGFPWAVLVVGFAVLLYLAVRDRPRTGGSSGAATPPPAAAPQPGEVPPWAPSDPTAQPEQARSREQAHDHAHEQSYAQSYSQAYGEPYGQPYQQPQPEAQPSRRRRTRRGRLLFGPTLALLALALGALGLYDANGGNVVPPAYPALALAVVGLMLVVGAFVGRPGGLVLLGLVSALALGVSSLAGAVDDAGGGDAQRLVATPTSAAAVKKDYFVPAGRVLLDLSDVSNPAALDSRSIDVGARAGELVVTLPKGVTVDVDAEISGPGQIDLPDRSTGGFGNRLQETVGSGTTHLDLHAHLFAGHIDVRSQ
jgi:phage shock protein PspC (stress-responsive transcriptional regulator)